MKANTAGNSMATVNFDNAANPAKTPAASHHRALPLSASRTSAHAMAVTNRTSGTSGDTLVINSP
jgi:hypothetical protein